jgi:chromosome segregation ATPase
MIKVTGACYGSLCHGMEENMLKARKANRVIRIPDEKKDAYAALGYKITDMNDKVVAEPHNAEKEAETLKTQVTDLETKLKEAAEYAENADKKIEAMEAENAKLKEQVTDLETKLKEATAKTKETKQATGGSEAGKQADSGKQATK